jgi:serine/threonine-protein phosphatase 2A regulatory subunit A
VTDGIDDDDEVLLALAAALGRMTDAVGGPQEAHLLFRPLECLLTVEDVAVREAACQSAKLIADTLPDASFLEHFVSLLERLADQQWFTARISAVTIICVSYPRFQNLSTGDSLTIERRNRLLQSFIKLCRDDTPMVRRVAAQQLGPMIKNVVSVHGRASLQDGGPVLDFLLPLLEDFTTVEHPDSVRLQAPSNCVEIGRVLNQLDRPLLVSECTIVKRVIPLIVATTDDRSWRVRWTVASQFSGVVEAYDPIQSSSNGRLVIMEILLPAYEKLLQDPEAEVRTAATCNLAHVARCQSRVLMLAPSPLAYQHSSHVELSLSDGVHVSVAERLVKRITGLTEDDSEHVRAALAMVATELAPVLGKDATITYLVPPVLHLLRDAASEVRLNLISSLSALNEVIGVDLLSQSLLPAILDLAQDGKWRIRLAIISHIPLLAGQLGKEFFTDKLVALCVAWLGDDIATVRQAAASNLKVSQRLQGTLDYCDASHIALFRQIEQGFNHLVWDGLGN